VVGVEAARAARVAAALQPNASRDIA